MGKELTPQLIKKLEENANLMMSKGFSEADIQDMSAQFIEEFGVEKVVKKKEDTIKSGSGFSMLSGTESKSKSPEPSKPTQSQTKAINTNPTMPDFGLKLGFPIQKPTINLKTTEQEQRIIKSKESNQTPQVFEDYRSVIQKGIQGQNKMDATFQPLSKPIVEAQAKKEVQQLKEQQQATKLAKKLAKKETHQNILAVIPELAQAKNTDEAISTILKSDMKDNFDMWQQFDDNTLLNNDESTLNDFLVKKGLKNADREAYLKGQSESNPKYQYEYERNNISSLFGAVAQRAKDYEDVLKNKFGDNYLQQANAGNENILNDTEFNTFISLKEKEKSLSTKANSLINDPRFSSIKKELDKNEDKQLKSDAIAKADKWYNPTDELRYVGSKVLYAAGKAVKMLAELPSLATSIDKGYDWTDKLADWGDRFSTDLIDAIPVSTDLKAGFNNKVAKVGNYKVIIDDNGEVADVRDNNNFKVSLDEMKSVTDKYNANPKGYKVNNEYNPRSLADNGLNTVIDMGLMILGTKGAGVLGAGAKMQKLTSMGIAYQQTKRDVFNDALKKGLDPKNADLLSNIIAVAAGASSSINPLEFNIASGKGLFNFIKTDGLNAGKLALIKEGKLSVKDYAKEFVKAGIKNTIGENIEELGIENTTQAIANNYFNSKISATDKTDGGLDDKLHIFDKQGLETFLITAGTSLLMTPIEMKSQMLGNQQEALKLAIDNPIDFKKIRQIQVEKGQLTQDEVDKEAKIYEDVSRTYNASKDEIKEELKPQLLALLTKKYNIANKINEIKDDVLSAPYKAQLNDINKGIQDITNGIIPNESLVENTVTTTSVDDNNQEQEQEQDTDNSTNQSTIMGQSAGKGSVSILTQEKIRIANKISKGEDLTPEESDFYKAVKEDIDKITAGSITPTQQTTTSKLDNDVRLIEITPEDRKEMPKQLSTSQKKEYINPATSTQDDLEPLLNKFKKRNEQVQVTPTESVEQGQQNNDGTGLSETAKEEVEGVSGSALKDVESTAKALEGVDISNIKETDTNTYQLPIPNNINEAKKSAEDLLKKAGFKYDYSGQSDSNGLSVYFYVDGVKVRFSDHSISNKDRMANEATFYFGNDSDQLKQGILDIKQKRGDKNIEYGQFRTIKRKSDGKELKAFGLRENITPQSLSEAYHKAKADGSNPELVKAVEDLLGKAPTQYTEASTPKDDTAVQSGSEQVGQEIPTEKVEEKLGQLKDNAWGSSNSMSENFYTTEEDGFAVKKPLKNPTNINIDGVDFHVAKVDGDWKVIDKTTGLEISTGKISNTKSSAIEDAEYRLKNNSGADNLPNITERAINRFIDSNNKRIQQIQGESLTNEVADKERNSNSVTTPENNAQNSENNTNLVEDKAENEYVNTKLTEQDNVEQEPSIKAIESQAESNSETELNEVVKKSDELINEAVGISRIPLSQLHTDESRFQAREKLNEQVVNDIANNFSDADQDPIHVWTDPKDGKTYVLSGHHRYYGAKKAGRTDVKIIDRTKDFTEKEAIKFATEDANANRSMETPLERANTLRKKRENGDSKEEINSFLEREGKNKTYTDNLSRLNPKGKAIQALQQLENSTDKVTQKETERIADWIGEARKSINGITDAHENEMFDFLMDKDTSKRITTKADFLQKVRSVVNPLMQDQPLNLNRFKNKTQGEQSYDEDVAEKKAEIAERQKQIDAINDRFTNPANPDYIRTNSADYEQARKIADDKISKLDAERKTLQKQLEDIYRNKGKYTSAATTGDLFGQDLVEDAIDRIANKIGSKKNLTEQERTSLTKDITDLAKGLIQMGKATIDNVIDKIKEEIKKRFPELDDKTVNEISENIEQKVILDAFVEKAKEKGLTYEQTKERLDKADADYNEQDLKDAFEVKKETKGKTTDKHKKELDDTKQRVANRFVLGDSKFNEVRQLVIENGYDKGDYDSEQIFKDVDNLIKQVGEENIEQLLEMPLSEPHRVVLQHRLFEHFGKISTDESLPEQVRKEAFQKSARYLLEYSRQRTDSGRANAILHQIYLDSDIYFTLPMMQEKMKALGTVLSDTEMAEITEMAKEIEQLRKENKELQELAKKEQEQQTIDDITNHLLVDELIIDSKLKDEIDVKNAKQRLGKNFQKIAERFGAIRMLEATEKSDFFEILHEMTKDLMTISKIGAKKAVKSVIKSIKQQHSNIDDNLLKEAQQYVLGQEKEETDIEDKNGNKISKGDLLELIEGGADTMDKLVEAIREKFHDGNKSITDKQIRDSITNYGNSTKKDRTDVEKKLSEIKALMLIQSKLEDALNNVHPKKTGVIREKDTIEVIQLRRQLAEAMKKLTGDMSENEIAGLNERKLTYLNNRIKEVEDVLKGITKDINKKAPFEYSQAVKDKQKELDDLMKQQDVLLHYTKEKLTNLAAKYQEKIDKKIYSKNPVLNKLSITDAEHQKLKKSLKDKKEQLKKDRDNFRNNDSDYLMQQMQKSVDKQIERIDDLLAGINKRKTSEQLKAERLRKQGIIDKNTNTTALQKLKDNQKALEDKKEKWEKIVIKKQIDAELAEQSKLRRMAGVVINNLISLSRTATLGLIDVGWLGVQGGYFMRTHPIMFANALKTAYTNKDLDEKSFNEWRKDLKNLDRYELMLKSGLRIPSQSLREEVFEQEYRQSMFTDFLEKYRLTRFVNKNGRLSVKFLAHLRMDMFNNMYNKLTDEQKQDTKTLEKLADFINVHSGAGGIIGENKNGNLHKAWGIMTSARNTSSMLQQTYLGKIYNLFKNYDHKRPLRLNPLKLSEDQPIVAQQIINEFKNQAVLFGTLFIAQAIARGLDDDDEKTGDWNIEYNPFSTDFLKLKGNGKEYFDMGGTTSLNVATLRLASMMLNMLPGFDIKNYKTDNGEGQVGGSSWYDQKGIDILAQAVTNRIVPLLSFIKNPLLAKKTKEENYKLFGEEYTPKEFAGKTLLDMFLPINAMGAWKDAKKIYTEKDDKLQNGVMTGVNFFINAFGVGVGQDNTGTGKGKSNSRTGKRSSSRENASRTTSRNIER